MLCINVCRDVYDGRSLQVPLRIHLCVVELETRYYAHWKVTLFTFVGGCPLLFCCCSSATEGQMVTFPFQLESGVQSDVLRAGVAGSKDHEQLVERRVMQTSATPSQLLYRTAHVRDDNAPFLTWST